MNLATGRWINLDGKNTRVADFDDDICMRLEKKIANRTAEESLRYECFSIECVPAVEFLVQRALASRAGELPVESILGLRGRCELVFVSLNSPTDNCRVQLFEHTHLTTVALETSHAAQL